MRRVHRLSYRRLNRHGGPLRPRTASAHPSPPLALCELRRFIAEITVLAHILQALHPDDIIASSQLSTAEMSRPDFLLIEPDSNSTTSTRHGTRIRSCGDSISLKFAH